MRLEGEVYLRRGGYIALSPHVTDDGLRVKVHGDRLLRLTDIEYGEGIRAVLKSFLEYVDGGIALFYNDYRSCGLISAILINRNNLVVTVHIKLEIGDVIEVTAELNGR